MSAYDGITSDYKIAMFAKNEEKIQTLRLILNALKNEEIQKGPGKELTSDEAVVVPRQLSEAELITAFHTVSAASTQMLDTQIEELLERGFQPHKKIAVSYDDHRMTTVYTQVMVKKDNK